MCLIKYKNSCQTAGLVDRPLRLFLMSSYNILKRFTSEVTRLIYAAAKTKYETV